MPGALVLDGHLKSALAIVRSLGSKGISVTVGGERNTVMAAHSRYASRHFVYPSPVAEPELFIESLITVLESLNDTPVIYACSDSTLIPLYEHRERLAEYATLLFPDQRAMEIAFDKAVTYSLARVIDIPTIPTYMPSTQDELIRVAEKLMYPVVLKPRKSLSHGGAGYRFGSAEYVHTPALLVERYAWYLRECAEPPLIQERIVGEEYGVETIAHRGSMCRVVAHHRIRSLSPSGGAAVVKETLDAGPLRTELEAYAEKIIRELRWEGPIMVEFKVDSDTRQPYLMEVNGRFWGSLPLSLFAGADMPYLYYELATGHHATCMPESVTNRAVSRHFLGDLRNLLAVLIARDPMRPYTYPSRRQALHDFFRIPQDTQNDVWLTADPLPSVYEYIDLAKKAWEK